jgi:3-phenylpropionate/trans-cinnamate dioxygenase ferredoxin subunit
MSTWTKACRFDEIESEDLIRFDHKGRTFVIYRAPDDEVFCTDGLCTHEKVHLEDGLVMDYEIECPKHSATFDYRTGEVLSAPACVNLKAYPARVNGDDIEVQIG